MKPQILHALEGVDLEDYARLIRREIDRSSDPDGFEGFSDPFLVRHFASTKQKSEKKLKLIEQAIRSGVPSPDTMQRVWLWAALGSVLLGLLLLIIPLDVLTTKRLVLHFICGFIVVVGSIWTPYRTTSPLAAVIVGIGLWFAPILWAFTGSPSRGLSILGCALIASSKLAILIWILDRERPLTRRDYENLKEAKAENRPFDDELERIKLLPEEERGEPLLALVEDLNERSDEILRKSWRSTDRVLNSIWTENVVWFTILTSIGLALVIGSAKLQGKS